MRMLRALLVVIALTALALPLWAAAAPKTLVVGLVAEPTSMDPGQLTDINSMRVLANVYDTLLRFKPESFVLQPGLAVAWKISQDGLTYTFTLRQGVRFHDGTAFNAAAVKFTFDRMLDPKHPAYRYGPYPFAGFYYGAVKQVRVTGPYTVQFILKQPYSPLLNSLTLNGRDILSSFGYLTTGAPIVREASFQPASPIEPASAATTDGGDPAEQAKLKATPPVCR